jgi:hypothetical protein
MFVSARTSYCKRQRLPFGYQQYTSSKRISMSSPLTAGSLLAVVLAALTTFVSPCLAETPDTLPANSRASRYGTGWECMTGFQRIANGCLRIVLPANAYLEASGSMAMQPGLAENQRWTRGGESAAKCLSG